MEFLPVGRQLISIREYRRRVMFVACRGRSGGKAGAQFSGRRRQEGSEGLKMVAKGVSLSNLNSHVQVGCNLKDYDNPCTSSCTYFDRISQELLGSNHPIVIGRNRSLVVQEDRSPGCVLGSVVRLVTSSAQAFFQGKVKALLEGFPRGPAVAAVPEWGLSLLYFPIGASSSSTTLE